MLASMAGARFLVSELERWDLAPHAAWTAGYLVMAALVVVGIVTSLVAAEPSKSAPVEATHARQNPLTRVIATAGGALPGFRPSPPGAGTLPPPRARPFFRSAARA